MPSASLHHIAMRSACMADIVARLVALVASGRERTKLACRRWAGLRGGVAAVATYEGFWVGGA